MDYLQAKEHLRLYRDKKDYIDTINDKILYTRSKILNARTSGQVGIVKINNSRTLDSYIQSLLDLEQELVKQTTELENLQCVILARIGMVAQNNPKSACFMTLHFIDGYKLEQIAVGVKNIGYYSCRQVVRIIKKGIIDYSKIDMAK